MAVSGSAASGAEREADPYSPPAAEIPVLTPESVTFRKGDQNSIDAIHRLPVSLHPYFYA